MANLERKEFRAAFIEAAETLNPTHAVTFAFNAVVQFDHQGLPIRGKDAKTCLRSVMMRLEHHLLGRPRQRDGQGASSCLRTKPQTFIGTA